MNKAHQIDIFKPNMYFGINLSLFEMHLYCAITKVNISSCDFNLWSIKNNPKNLKFTYLPNKYAYINKNQYKIISLIGGK